MATSSKPYGIVFSGKVLVLQPTSGKTDVDATVTCNGCMSNTICSECAKAVCCRLARSLHTQQQMLSGHKKLT